MTCSARHISYALRLVLITSISILSCITSSWAEPVNGRKSPKAIVAVIHCNYSPVSFLNKTTNIPSGFFVDIMDIVAARTGLQVGYICKNSWDEMITAIESNEADVGALMKSKEREKKLLFTVPIETSYLSYFARAQSDVDPARVPSGHSVGVVKGGMSHEQLKDRAGVKLEIYSSYRDGLFGLLAGEISLFAGEESMVLKQMQEARLEDRIKKVGKPFIERQRGLVARKDDAQLHQLLDNILHDFVGGPEYQRIYLKWYGAPAPYWTNRKILTISGVFLVITVVGMAFWRYASLSRINTELLRTITESKRANERLRLHGTIIKNMAEGVHIIRLEDGIIVYTNASFENMFGYDPDEMIGKNVSMLNAPNDKTPEATKQTIMDILAETGEWHGEIENIRKDGTRFWCHANVLVFEHFDDGKVIVSVHTDITDQKKAQEQILHSLQEKEVLLKEIHHRVKNNMQVIYSLLNLQAKSSADTAVRVILEESRDRVNSMALIHEKLYQSKDMTSIDFKEYLQSLVHGIIGTYKRHDIQVSVDMDSLALDVNVGIPCGLIVNELVSNSLKYAFPEGKTGTIKLGINKNSEGNHVLTVADNGIGFSPEVDFRNTLSLGMKLVNVLTGQIHGTIVLSQEEGTTFSITFPGSPDIGSVKM